MEEATRRFRQRIGFLETENYKLRQQILDIAGAISATLPTEQRITDRNYEDLVASLILYIKDLKFECDCLLQERQVLESNERSGNKNFQPIVNQGRKIIFLEGRIRRLIEENKKLRNRQQGR